MNATDICNLALSRIGNGAKNTLQNYLTDTSEAAAACRIGYDIALETLVDEYQWGFLRASTALSLVTQVIPGYTRVYAYPANCAFLDGIGPENGNPNRLLGQYYPFPFSIYQSESSESSVIACDLPDAWAFYKAKVTNPAFAPAWFQNVFAWRLARELAISLKASTEAFQIADRGYQSSIGSALATDANQRAKDYPYTPETLRSFDVNHESDYSVNG